MQAARARGASDVGEDVNMCVPFEGKTLQRTSGGERIINIYISSERGLFLGRGLYAKGGIYFSRGGCVRVSQKEGCATRMEGEMFSNHVCEGFR